MSNSLSIANVSMGDCVELKVLIERKMGLVELSKTLKKGEDGIYEKLVIDLGKTEYLIKEWWSRIHLKYKIKKIPGANIHLDFDTGEINAIMPERNKEISIY